MSLNWIHVNIGANNIDQQYQAWLQIWEQLLVEELGYGYAEMIDNEQLEDHYAEISNRVS